MPRGTAIGWICALLAAALAGLTGTVLAQEVGELVALADPRSDDWTTETFERDAKEQLDRVARLLESAETEPPAGLWVRSARGHRLRPESLETLRLPGETDVRVPVRSSRKQPMVPLARALRELAGSLTPATDVRVRFKIVGVEARPDGHSTRVRYEAAVRRGEQVLQQTAHWDIRWKQADDGAAPLMAEVSLVDFEELSRDRLAMVEATAAAIPDSQWTAQLAYGGEYWHGRLDAIGEPYLMGHQGIAVGDWDGDGLEDLYVAMGNGLPNKLLLHHPDGTTHDVAEAAGLAWLDDTKGCLFADMDNDGDQDLLSAVGPTIVLCVNDGAGKCGSYVSMRAPTPAAFYSLSVADFDLDGDLDIYGARYVKVQYAISVPVPFHDADNGPSNRLIRNEGEGRFTDVTESVGLGENNSRFSLVGVWNDYDDDGDPDLYVANDFGRNNLYRNDGGSFVDVAAAAGVEDQAAGMGVSWGDYDQDGDADLYVTNMYSAAGQRVAYQPRFRPGEDEATLGAIRHHSLGNSLLQNQGDGTFRDVSDAAGVRMGRWGWGARFIDLDGDGYQDLVVPNGFLTGALEDDL